MDEDSLIRLEQGSEEEVSKVLTQFNAKNAQVFNFPDIDKETKQQIVKVALAHLNDPTYQEAYVPFLETLRILSRDKAGLEALTTDELLKTMVKLAGLECFSHEEGEQGNGPSQQGNPQVVIEAQKCLCNLIFNSSSAQRICCNNGCVEGIVQRLKTYKDPELQHEIKFFDMRMLFLLTALCADIRPKLRTELHGLTYLIEVLDLCLKDSAEQGLPMSDADVDLCCEVLKILFNLTVSMDRFNIDEEEEAHCLRLVSLLHDLLVCKTVTPEKGEELVSHTVNLLTNMPRASYEELLTPINEGSSAAASGGAEDNKLEYDGNNVDAVVSLLQFLDRRLERSHKNIKESLTPILHCMCEICRAKPVIRKFCRLKVLPYLKDEVKHLPGEGDTLRNKLCRLLTSPITEIKELAADFLFVLCKEKVGRMVKYTGYGNAAGLLANRGLMLGGRGSGEYSESSDSDTEEYSRLRDQVNPVTGRWEMPRPNPMEGMTEEQKEYEAVKLANLMEKLTRDGVIQPSRIGEDGRPQPIEHVLELTAGLEAAQGHNDDSDSD
ncbi:synembryn-A isoform X3 [Lingula anatina]|uniref:Synembryn-A isoform X3 n=1 Tax=Lingula anatina TaxID=7574 RepID=A0A1S3J7A8_LINAN|nr:synembryn-A isoform X3 [Lingula anatina]|eukprot:XP_013406285.1 synembryn-A isoform X3 [Lingula anatina]